MSRNRKSAKQAGARFERHIADYLAHTIDDRIDRKPKTGAKDKGDIGGLRHKGHRLVAELKNTTRTTLSTWIKEAHTEAGNDDAACGIIIHKRKGRAHPADQYVTMTVDDLVFLITGQPQERRYEP